MTGLRAALRREGMKNAERIESRGRRLLAAEAVKGGGGGPSSFSGDTLKKQTVEEGFRETGQGYTLELLVQTRKGTWN